MEDYSPELLFDMLERQDGFAVFGQLLDCMAVMQGAKESIARTALWIHNHSEYMLKVQIKLRKRVVRAEGNGKIMVFYLLHEYLKHAASVMREVQARKLQVSWFQTVDEVIQECVRDINKMLYANGPDMRVYEQRRKLSKTLKRWEEKGLFLDNHRDWNKLIQGELKPNRLPPSLPFQLISKKSTLCFKRPLHRSENPYLQPFSAGNVKVLEGLAQDVGQDVGHDVGHDVYHDKSMLETMEKSHWRYTTCFFLRSLAESLELSSKVLGTALVFFHTVFDLGIYKKERFRVGSACLLLASKSHNIRLKLFRVVRAKFAILHKVLLEGDEEVEEMEKLILLAYELETVKGIDYEINVVLPFDYLNALILRLPSTVSSQIAQKAHDAVFDLQFSPMVLAEAAVYISCKQSKIAFDFKWCFTTHHHTVPIQILTEQVGEYINGKFRAFQLWVVEQEKRFQNVQKLAKEPFQQLGSVNGVDDGHNVDSQEDNELVEYVEMTNETCQLLQDPKEFTRVEYSGKYVHYPRGGEKHHQTWQISNSSTEQSKSEQSSSSSCSRAAAVPTGVAIVPCSTKRVIRGSPSRSQSNATFRTTRNGSSYPNQQGRNDESSHRIRTSAQSRSRSQSQSQSRDSKSSSSARTRRENGRDLYDYDSYHKRSTSSTKLKYSEGYETKHKSPTGPYRDSSRIRREPEDFVPVRRTGPATGSGSGSGSDRKVRSRSRSVSPVKYKSTRETDRRDRDRKPDSTRDSIRSTGRDRTSYGGGSSYRRR